MQTLTTVKHLKIAAGAVIGFGLITALAAHPPAARPTLLLIDVFLWPAAGPHTLATPEARLLCAISGGLTVGLGVMLWLVATRLYVREPALARTIMLAGLGSWFAVDSMASVIAGAPFNVVANSAFLAAFLVPLWMAARP
jgi:hypothetical protein